MNEDSLITEAKIKLEKLTKQINMYLLMHGEHTNSHVYDAFAELVYRIEKEYDF